MQAGHSTIDPSEVAKFEAMAAEWWDPNGKFKPLHMLNPCRLDYITGQIAAEFDRDLEGERPFAGCGCSTSDAAAGCCRTDGAARGRGGGRRRGRTQHSRAELHAEQSGLTIDYRFTTAEAMAAAGEQFDVVLNMEVVEHVADPLAYLTACRQLLRNRAGCTSARPSTATPRALPWPSSGAEYVMRWLPKGTHEWKIHHPGRALRPAAQGRAGPGRPQGIRVQPRDVAVVGCRRAI